MRRAVAHVSGHAPIYFDLEDHEFLSAETLVRYFEEQLRSEVKFEAGQTIQVGAALILLQARDDALIAVEPTYDSMPIAWKPGVTSTLRHLTLQLGLCAEVGVEAVFPSIRQSLVTQKDYESATALVFERDTPPVGNSSGWLVRSPERNSDEAGLVSIYEAIIHQPRLAPFLALPVGASVTLSRTLVTVAFDGRTVSSGESKLLDGLLAPNR